MSKQFNLLSLHSPTDIHPRSWVCLSGDNIKTIVNRLEKEIIARQNISRRGLSEKIGKTLNCSPSIISQLLHDGRKFYHIPIILELLKFSNRKKSILQEIKQNIQYLKVNSASAKPVKAIHRLNENLSKIIGAFMADGSLSIQQVFASKKPQHLHLIERALIELNIKHPNVKFSASRKQYYINIQLGKKSLVALNDLLLSSSLFSQTHYNIELIDEYKDSVKAFMDWIKEEFEISPIVFGQKRNAWYLTFSNKILARYLMCFFDITPGPKAYSAFEPDIIKTSPLKTRKAFAKGVLMFDGCVTVDKKIVLGLRSKILINAIKEIWEQDNLNIGISNNQHKQGATLFTTSKNNTRKLEQYFEKNTQKWKLLKWLEGDLSQKPIIKPNSSAASVGSFLKIIRKVGLCDTAFLSEHFKCYPHSVRNYLKILKRQKKIKLSNTPVRLSEFISPNTTVLLKKRVHVMIFTKGKKTFKTDKNFADFLNIKKATFSAWRVRKNRIPFHILKQMCSVLSIDFQKIHSNIEKTDREIAEII